MTFVAKSFASWDKVRLPFVLALVTLVISLIVSSAMFQYARRQTDAALHADFAFQVRQTVRRIEQRMATYEQVARGVQAALLGTVHTNREDFRLFVHALRLEENFPGIQGLALVEAIPAASMDQHVRRIRDQGIPDYAVHPTGNRELYSAIIQIEPFTGLNLRALGYDMLTDQTRRAAMERARDTGKAVTSHKVKLIQENGHREQAGVIMYLPLYKRGQPTGTLEERQKNLIGWIGAPFRMDDLMAGLGGERSNDILLTIYDDDAPTPGRVLYESAGTAALGAQASLFTSRQKVSVASSIWTLDIGSSQTYEARIDRDKPRIIGMVGVATSFLVAFLVWTLASGRTRAETLASAMTLRLRESNLRVVSEQRRVQVILDNTHDAFVALDRKGCVTDWNVQAERIFGWSASEAVGQDLAELIVPVELRSAHRAGFKRFSGDQHATPIKRVVEVEGLHRSGYRIPLELAIAGVPEQSGTMVSAFIRDMSERNAAARQEAQRTQALKEAQAALQHAQRLEAVGKLTGGVAHDFNNVLQILGGNIQILERLYAHEDSLLERLASMSRAVERGTKLSADLLAFARRQPLRPVVLNLKHIVADLDDSLGRALGETFSLETVVEDELWNTLVDRSQLENVILNLAVNSRDAMPNGGKLLITLRNVVLDMDDVALQPEALPGEYVQIAFTDNGEGMTEDTIAQAFEPFFTTKRAGEGTGLGLSMAYGFVKQSGGHIRLQSQPNEGTTVKIYLPRSTELEAPVATSVDQPISGGSETILVVEDDLGVQTTVVTMLEELGYRVVTADDGQGALALLEEGLQPDLLFTDVVMPGPVPSTELARQAKRIVPDVAILFTSGYTHNALIRGGRLNDGVELLSKPYRREELARTIRHLITGAVAARATEPKSSKLRSSGF